MAAARARGALACPSSARHCASFAWRTRLPRKPKWRILWNPLMQCTALEALCRAQGYVVLLNGNAAVTASSGPIVVHNPAPAHRGSTEVLAHRVRWSAPFQAVSVQRSSARERFERTNRPQDYVAQYESIRHRSGLISKGCMTHQPQNLHNAEVYIKPLMQCTALQGLPGIATHAHAWGIDHRQAHVIATLVLGRAGITQPALVVVDALCADLCCLLAARHTREHGRVVSGQHLHGLALSWSEAFSHHAQCQLGGSTEVVLVGARRARREHVLQGDVHGPGPEFVSSAGHIVFTVDAKLAHV